MYRKILLVMIFIVALLAGACQPATDMEQELEEDDMTDYSLTDERGRT